MRAGARVGRHGRQRLDERDRHVLDVGVVLGVDAVAHERDREGDRADEQARDGHAEGDAQVVRELR